MAITYDIPDGFSVGAYTYIANFTDDYGNSVTDIVIFTVTDTTNPLIVSAPADLNLEPGYSGEALSWSATDAHPDTCEIELQETGIVTGALPWTSGDPITFNIPDGLPAGDYVYTATFTDESGNFISNSVTVTINEGSGTPAPAGGVPFGNYFLLFIGLSVICLIFVKKRQMHNKADNKSKIK